MILLPYSQTVCTNTHQHSTRKSVTTKTYKFDTPSSGTHQCSYIITDTVLDALPYLPTQLCHNIYIYIYINSQAKLKSAKNTLSSYISQRPPAQPFQFALLSYSAIASCDQAKPSKPVAASSLTPSTLFKDVGFERGTWDNMPARKKDVVITRIQFGGFFFFT